jgi:hypothetical protein
MINGQRRPLPTKECWKKYHTALADHGRLIFIFKIEVLDWISANHYFDSSDAIHQILVNWDESNIWNMVFGQRAKSIAGMAMYDCINAEDDDWKCDANVHGGKDYSRQ